MRFILKEDKLIPVNETTDNSLPISRIATIPQPPLNNSFPFNKELQQLLTGKQLLIDDLPFTLEEIQTHYENGYITLRKGIEYAGSRIVAMSFCEPRSCRLQLSS